MKLESKYDIGQKIWIVRRFAKQINKECGFCSGSGRAIGADLTGYTCPVCIGRGYNKDYEKIRYNVLLIGTIGLVRIERREAEGYSKQEVQYMCYQTGIGSGSVYNEDDCFTSEREANKEAERRNHEESKRNRD